MEDLTPLQSKIHSFAKYFFPAKFFFCILEKENLAGKNLLFKRVNLLCKGVFALLSHLFLGRVLADNF
jgi:hypothetical protein